MDQEDHKGLMRKRGGGNRNGVLFLAWCMILCWTPAWGQSGTTDVTQDDLLDTLHKKQVITDQEYNQLKEQEQQSEKKHLDFLKKEIIPKALEGLEIGTLSYIDYSYGRRNTGKKAPEETTEEYNRFTLTRGYINIKKSLTSWLGFRVTPDVYQDDAGDFNLRLKYLYAELRPPSVSFLTDMKAEVGMGHIPWLDFEEHVNPYRCQGTMFIERAGIINSADIGVGIMGYIDNKLPEEYQKQVNKYYAGRYGSWHIGVYNGAGYHATEVNNNKIPEVRITIRPLPGMIPGLQVSYFGLFGEGNRKQANDESPDFNVNLAMVSYQDKWFTFTGQYARTLGNQEGDMVDTDGRALRTEGWSLFAMGRLPLLDRKLALFARYDNFDPDTNDWVTPGDDHYQIAIGGLSYEFYKNCLVLLAYEDIMYQKNNGGLGEVPALDSSLEDEWKIQLVCQIEF